MSQDVAKLPLEIYRVVRNGNKVVAKIPDRPISSHAVRAMRDQLVHRGPDAHGIFVSPDGQRTMNTFLGASQFGLAAAVSPLGSIAGEGTTFRVRLPRGKERA